MNQTVTIKAPAKINLTLDVVGKRSNGYHDLKMIMQTIDLHDTLSIQCIPENEIRLTMSPELPEPIPPEKNLVWKAAKLLKDSFWLHDGFQIHIDKKIPVAAGLAGGSADCAAALLGINTLCQLHLNTERLCQLGVSLGADVPFCIRKGTMLAEGIGDILTPLPALSPLWVLLIKPAISVSTAYVYNALDSTPIPAHPETIQVIDCIQRHDAPGMAKKLSNVLESVTIPEHPILSQLKQFFQAEGAIGTLMSGSGPTTYGLYQDEIMANIVFQKAKLQFPDCTAILCQAKSPKNILSIQEG